MAKRRRSSRRRGGFRRRVDMQTFVLCRDQILIDPNSGDEQCAAFEQGPSGIMIEISDKPDTTMSQSSISKGWIFKGGRIDMVHTLRFQDVGTVDPNALLECLFWEALVVVPDQVDNDPRQFETGIPAYIPNLFRSAGALGNFDSYYDILWRRLSRLRTCQFTPPTGGVTSMEQLMQIKIFATEGNTIHTREKVRARRRISETNRLFYVRNAALRAEYPLGFAGIPAEQGAIESNGHIWYACHHLSN